MIAEQQQESEESIDSSPLSFFYYSVRYSDSVCEILETRVSVFAVCSVFQ